jgi:hypothetical protein
MTILPTHPLFATYDATGTNLYVTTVVSNTISTQNAISRYSPAGGAGTSITNSVFGIGFGDVYSIYFQSDTQFLITADGNRISRYNLNDTVATLDPTFGTKEGMKRGQTLHFAIRSVTSPAPR